MANYSGLRGSTAANQQRPLQSAGMGNTNRFWSRDIAERATSEHSQRQPLPAKGEEAGALKSDSGGLEMWAALNGSWGVRCKQQPLPLLWLLRRMAGTRSAELYLLLS